MADPAEATVRNAEFSDCEPVESLLSAFGLGMARKPEDVRRWWDWIWRRNPALALDRPHPPIGWLLEAGGQVVGFFGNIPARYRFGDETLMVAVASHWAVQKPFRSRTQDLSSAYFGQREADLLMVTTGIAATGRIFDRFGASVMPLRDYRRVLYWVLEPSGFAVAALRKRNVPPALARIAGLAASPGLAAANALRKRGPRRLPIGLDPEAIPLEAVGDEFDELWQRKLAEGRRLYAYRTAADLRWHFELARTGAVSVLRCRRGGRLEGYAVLLREEVPAIALQRLKIVDLFVASNDADTIDALLAAAYERGREAGCHVLEVVGFPAEIRARVERFRPFSRLAPAHPFYYKARSEALDRALEAPAAWYPCLYDGDGSIHSIPAS